MYYRTLSISEAGTTDWIKLESSGNFNRQPIYTIGLVISGTLTADIEFTINPQTTGANVYCHPILNGRTASVASDLSFPAGAFRLNVTSYTSGTATIEILQANG